jgi:E3 ubiquitin-protein ligase BRE1
VEEVIHVTEEKVDSVEAINVELAAKGEGLSKRIYRNQIARLLREEKEMNIKQLAALTTKVEAQNQVVMKLKEIERLLQNILATVEKELQLRQQAMEMHKKKAIESAQSAANLKYHSKIKEVQQTVAEKLLLLRTRLLRQRECRRRRPFL